MKIIKIIERQLSPNDEGEYCVYCQMLVGRAYQYGLLLFESESEARQAKEGDIIDIEKVRFSRRINGVQV